MSYTHGTDLGTLREMLGDTNTSNELFSDDYLNSLISKYGGANGLAAEQALYRVLNDPDLLIRRYHRFGSITPNMLSDLQRALLSEIQQLRLTSISSKNDFLPEANQTGRGRTTDEDGWYERQDIDSYIRGLG